MNDTVIDAILEWPALPPPEGQEPDFSPDRNSSLGYGVTITCSVLTVLSCAVRAYSRFLLRRVNIEDGLFVVAFGLYAGFQYVMYDYSIWPGIKVNQWDVQMKHSPQLMQEVAIASILFGLVIMFLKAGILLDWLRLFLVTGTSSNSKTTTNHADVAENKQTRFHRRRYHHPHHRRSLRSRVRAKPSLYWTAHSLLWANVIFYLFGTAILLYAMFACVPRTTADLRDVLEQVPMPPGTETVDELYETYLHSGQGGYGSSSADEVRGSKCPDTALHSVASGAVNLLSDLVILALPQGVIWRLQVRGGTRKKLGLSALFAVGVFACICALARLVYVARYAYSYDQVYFLGVMGLWSMGEMTAGFLIVGMPCLPMVLQHMPRSIRALFGVSSAGNSGRSYSNSRGLSVGAGTGSGGVRMGSASHGSVAKKGLSWVRGGGEVGDVHNGGSSGGIFMEEPGWDMTTTFDLGERGLVSMSSVRGLRDSGEDSTPPPTVPSNAIRVETSFEVTDTPARKLRFQAHLDALS